MDEDEENIAKNSYDKKDFDEINIKKRYNSDHVEGDDQEANEENPIGNLNNQIGENREI